MIDYLANSLIFTISGIIIAGKVYTGHQAKSPCILTGTDYGWAVALWLLLLVETPHNVVHLPLPRFTCTTVVEQTAT